MFRNIPAISFILLISLLYSAESQTYLTDPNRTETVKKHCTQTRKTFIDKYEKYQASTFAETQTENAFKINGTKLIIDLINGNSDDVSTQLNDSRGSFAAYFGFFIIPLGIMIIISPFLACCCICPNSCPLCCKQPIGKPYTSCQRKFPAIVVIVLSLIIIVCMIFALSYRTSIHSGYQQTRCSIGILFDDIINGNVSIDESSYFIGIQSARDVLLKIRQNQNQTLAVIEPITTNGADIVDINNDIDSGLDDIRNIPDGSGGALVLNYNSPIINAVTTTTVDSTFPAVLGTQFQNGTLIENAHTGLFVVKVAIQGISVLAEALKTAFQAFNSAITNILADLKGIIDGLYQNDAEVNRVADDGDSIVRVVNIVFYILTIILLVLAILSLVAAVLLGLCQKSACRFLTYITCGLMLILGITMFLLAIIYSILTPAAFYACTYIKTGISSPDNFITFFGPILNDNDTVKLLSVCAIGGTGDLSNGTIKEESLNVIRNMSEIVKQLKSFNGSVVFSELDTRMLNLVTTVGNYKNARVLDITDAGDISSLQKVSNASQYICTAPGFTDDSWIPSITQNPQYVSCKVSGSQSNYQTCGNSDVNVLSRAAGCTGCMDTYNIFESKTSGAQVLTVLTARYPGCAVFPTQLSNIWTNFYQKKKDTLTPVQTRSTDARTKTTAIQAKYTTNIKPKFDAALTQLETSFSTILDPKFGIIAGFNCKVIGEDINLNISVICQLLFEYSFVLRILFAISGWAIMFLLCFTVCLGVRNRNKNLSERHQFYEDTNHETSNKLTPGQL